MDASVSFCWLGVAGIELRLRGRVLLIDPFVSRPPFRRMWFGRVEPDHALIAGTIPRCDVVLVTHAHWDHLMDVPEVAARGGAVVYGSPNTCALLRRLGTAPERVHALAVGDRVRLDEAGVAVGVVAAVHGNVLGRPVFTGPLPRDLRPPLRLRDYRMDVDFSFLLESDTCRLLDWSSERAEDAVPADVLFVKPIGTRAYFEQLLRLVQPRLVIPIHWDDLYRPLSRGLRPMIGPPRWSVPPFRRVDLAAFQQTIRQVAPQARVFVPDLFRVHNLRDLASG